jgi:hypothetical protein
VGLGLWQSVAATVVVEIGMYAAGVALYVRATQSRDRVEKWALLGLVVFLLVAYLTNAPGAPPPSVEAATLSTLALIAILPLWGWWIERHRTSHHRFQAIISG